MLAAPNTKGSGLLRCPLIAGYPAHTTISLLDFGLEVGSSTISHFDLKLHFLALGGERMPGHHLVLAGRYILDLERAIVLHNRKVRTRHREKEALHELMLVALQPVVAILLCTATEHHRLIELVTLLGQTNVESGGRAGALH